MSNFEDSVRALCGIRTLSSEELSNTLSLLNLYAPLVQQSLERMEEYTEECYASRRQSVTDFINLAVDYDHDADSQNIACRLADAGHSMTLLKLLETALLRLREDPRHGGIYYRIISARYFDCYCRTNEDAFLRLGISSSTFYRHLKDAQKAYGALLWHVVIPDFIIAVRSKASGDGPPSGAGEK